MNYPLSWEYTHGGPAVTAKLKACADDFVVTENLGFEPEGQGEHVFLWVEKRDSNTTWVAESLAKHAGVPPVAVGYSGLKDRMAVTRQWFSVLVPPSREPDWTLLNDENITVMQSVRHLRKLKKGVHKSNHFSIKMRHCNGDRDKLIKQLKAIKTQGFPNYFGEQRFGRSANNLRGAERLFAGAKVKRQQRSFFLSAARSWLFNHMLSARINNDSWLLAKPDGHYFLSGSGSHFMASGDADLAERVLAGDIHPAVPMWGKTKNALSEEESSIRERFVVFCEGLEAAGLNMEYRAGREIPQDFEWVDEGEDIVLSFTLGRGCFATALLRECFNWSKYGAD